MKNTISVLVAFCVIMLVGALCFSTGRFFSGIASDLIIIIIIPYLVLIAGALIAGKISAKLTALFIRPYPAKLVLFAIIIGAICLEFLWYTHMNPTVALLLMVSDATHRAMIGAALWGIMLLSIFLVYNGARKSIRKLKKKGAAY